MPIAVPVSVPLAQGLDKINCPSLYPVYMATLTLEPPGPTNFEFGPLSGPIAGTSFPIEYPGVTLSVNSVYFL